MPLLEASSVVVQFQGRDESGRSRLWAAVDGVTLCVEEGERVGIVGESGSGKTTLGKALLGIEPLARGKVLFRGEDVNLMKGSHLESFKRGVQMIFQDPLGSLNPRMTVGDILSEVLAVHRLASRAERPKRVAALLEQVGLDAGYLGRYPHEFSGGQRQRIGIARALALNPALLVADEPVSALDVSVQAQILNLVRDLSEARHMAVILVAHDLAVVNYVCDRVLIMNKGRVVEEGPTRNVFRHPRHPYTQLLKASVPDPDDESLFSLQEQKGPQRPVAFQSL
jgi:ABC-type glutathione transport system ATPase component